MVGDIIGSHWEFNPTKEYNSPLFWGDSHFTDDTVMSMAVTKWLIDCMSLSTATQMYPIHAKIGDQCWERIPKEFQDIILQFQFLVNE